MRTLASLITAILLITGATAFSASPPAMNEAQHAHYMAQRHGFNEKKLLTLYKKSHILPKVLQTISRPYEAKPWQQYKHYLLTTQRIDSGIQFYHQHRSVLEKVSKQYGVPASIITAIIGVETNYGKHTFSFPALDSLVTLSFHYPKRAHFFQTELEALLLLAREKQLDPQTLQSSYAGALGIPQFMPSSYRHYAVSYPTSSKRPADLLHKPQDAIASVAYYFKQHGWHSQAPIALAIEKIPAHHATTALSSTEKQPLPLAQWAHSVFPIQEKLLKAYPKEPAALLTLPGKRFDERWLVFHNFRVIKRYNPSDLYAILVVELAQAIDQGILH